MVYKNKHPYVDLLTSEGCLLTTGYLSSSFTNPPAITLSTVDTVCVYVKDKERYREYSITNSSYDN